MTEAAESTRAQIDRIVQSKTLQSSQVLRRLLVFLADKSLCGEGDQIKEYTIGIDAFGKPSSYDPKQDSTVRIQVGRLRQKLAEYYQTEGKDDLIVVELPKGRYKLNWQTRPPVEVVLPVGPPPEAALRPISHRTTVLLSAGLIAVTVWAVYATLRLRDTQQSAVFHSEWTPEIASLWTPFVDTERPLLIAISAPMFVELPGYGVFRDLSVNHPEDIPKSPAIAALQKALHLPVPQPVMAYSTLGGAHVSFMLGKLLAARKANVSLVNSNELSWRQVSGNNLIVIGSTRFFNQLASMPVKTELLLEAGVGIRNLKPLRQEPASFIDQISRQTGLGYVLVSHTPGPLADTDVMSFAGRSGASIMGAVAWFAEPKSARDLVAHLKKRSGEIPRYYQVVLQVRFQDGVPLETSYVLHRELPSSESK